MYPDNPEHAIRFWKYEWVKSGNERVRKVTDRHSWDDFRLIPSTPPSVPQPTPNFKFIDVPGREDSIDATYYLTDKLTYSDRTGTLEFIVYPDTKLFETWATRKNTLASFFDGSEMQMMLDDDPTYAYWGRFYLKEWTPGEAYATVSIEYRVRPYKCKTNNSDKKELG